MSSQEAKVKSLENIWTECIKTKRQTKRFIIKNTKFIGFLCPFPDDAFPALPDKKHRTRFRVFIIQTTM